MKKLLTILLTMLLSISLFGCGGNKNSIVGTWYDNEDQTTWYITNDKVTVLDDEGNKDRYEVAIMDDKLVLKQNDELYTLKYELSEDGNTVIMSANGLDVEFKRK